MTPAGSDGQAPVASRVPGWLQPFPGSVVLLEGGGVIVASNGRLEQLVEQEVVGAVFADLLDKGPSRTKWDRMWARIGARAPEPGWELILCAGDRPLDPRRFAVLPEPEGTGVWLVEHPADPGVDAARMAVMDMNAELVETQRELVREQHRLSAALEELERSNRALDEFAHAVSHDLRAPLRSIAYYARWLREDADPPLGAAALEHLDRIEAQTSRMQGMVEGVLQYARAGRVLSQPESVRLEDVVDDIVHLLAPPSSVRVTTGRTLPPFRTERSPFQQVLLNLIANAITHGGDAVHVTVEAEDRGREVEVAVADDGPGIPPALRERVWELFHTGAAAAEGKGSGIGLAVVRRLVEDRGGRAWIDETSGQPGATIRFIWPKDSRRGRERGE